MNYLSKNLLHTFYTILKTKVIKVSIVIFVSSS